MAKPRIMKIGDCLRAKYSIYHLGINKGDICIVYDTGFNNLNHDQIFIRLFNGNSTWVNSFYFELVRQEHVSK